MSERFLYDGWAAYQQLITSRLRDLTPDQLALRPGPGMWAIWQIASHMAGGRAYWFHDILGEGDPATGAMFRVSSTTVPDLPLEEAAWEDDEDHPRDVREILDGFDRTWIMVNDCLKRWTADDLAVEFPRRGRSGTQMRSRGWVIWHLMEHDVHHGGEISLILGSNGFPGLNL